MSTPSAKLERPNFTSATILIVDDESRNRKLLEALLQPEGYVTLTASDGEAALACVESHRPDLILLDVMMPGIDGLQVTRLLKANPETCHIPIILVTARDDRAARLAGLEAGAEDFLGKPVDRAELWLRARNLLRLKALGDLLLGQNSNLESQVEAQTLELDSLSLRTARRERMLSNTLASISDFAYIYDREGRYLYANKPLLDLWGITLEEALGKSFRDLGYPEELAVRLDREVQSVFATGEPVTGETLYTSPAGIENCYEYIFSPALGPDGTPEFVVGTTRDISERRRAAGELQRQEREQRELAGRLAIEQSRLIDAQRIGKIGSWMTDVATLATIWSEETHRIHETDPGTFDPTHQNFLELVHPDDRDMVDGEFVRSLPDTTPCNLVHRLLLPDGRIKFIEERWQVLHDEHGEPQKVTGTRQDITERKEAEIRIHRLNRGYLVLSQINSLIVRARDREELFHETCRIAVDSGEFRLAWIGEIDPVSLRVVPVASAGDGQEFLKPGDDGICHFEAGPAGQGPVARAVRERQPVVINDLASELRIRSPATHGGSGIRSMASLPLVIDGQIVAVLCLYARDPEYFNDPEMELLRELSGDIAFALDYMAKAERLNYQAYFDSLTGLANHSLFLQRAEQCLLSAANAGHDAAMVMLDVERFKSINDSLGKHIGNDLLKQLGAWLAANVREATVVSRVGADHFALMFPHAHDPGDAAREIERLIADLLEHSFVLDGSALRISAKFGVAVFPHDGSDADTLFRHAEAALKKAKAGGDRYLFYTQSMTEEVARKLTLENQLRDALDNEEFVLHYQPKVNLQSGKITSAEALIRWNNPRTGLMPPGLFIPVLEETGFIYEVGRWALRKARDEYLRWRDAGLPAVRIAVNVSPLQLRNSGFIAEVAQVIGIDPRAAEGLELEITESMIMENIHQSIASLQAIRGMGIPIAIDDFGTGFSSLGYLSKLPVDTLKIDRSFIVDMAQSPEGLSLVSTMIKLGHSMRLKVVAEGVETEAEAKLLRLLGCDEMQGYLFSAAVDCDVFQARFLSVPA